MSNLISLTEQTAADGEVFALGENGSIPRGQLQRFLKIMGPVLDEMKGLIDTMQAMTDVDNTDIDYLPYMAALLGLDYNSDIPTAQARTEVKQTVPWYKRKGTTEGCSIHGYRVTRLQTAIDEFVYSIRTSNRTYSYSADFVSQFIRGTCSVSGPITINNVSYIATTVTDAHDIVLDAPRSGVCNTAGENVSWVSGDIFTGLSGATIIIDGLPYTILYVTGPKSLTLTSSAGTNAGVAFNTPSTGTQSGVSFNTPDMSGVCNTSGVSVTWVSGDVFTDMKGNSINWISGQPFVNISGFMLVDGDSYSIVSVTDSQNLIITPAARMNTTATFQASTMLGSRSLLYGLHGDNTAYSYDYDQKSVLVPGSQFSSDDVASTPVTGHESVRAIDGEEATSWTSSTLPGWWAYDFGTYNGVCNVGYSNICSTNGTAVTGSGFTGLIGNIVINHVNYIITSVTDDNHLSVSQDAGIQSNVPYSVNNVVTWVSGDTFDGASGTININGSFFNIFSVVSAFRLIIGTNTTSLSNATFIIDDKILPTTLRVTAGLGLKNFRLQWSDIGLVHGTCTITGSSVTWVSGDLFTSLPGSVNINGSLCGIKSVSSGTSMTLLDSIYGGTCNTVATLSTTTVTLIRGIPFTGISGTITINGTGYTIASVISATQLTISGTAPGTHNSASFTVTSPTLPFENVWSDVASLQYGENATSVDYAGVVVNPPNTQVIPFRLSFVASIPAPNVIEIIGESTGGDTKLTAEVSVGDTHISVASVLFSVGDYIKISATGYPTSYARVSIIEGDYVTLTSPLLQYYPMASTVQGLVTTTNNFTAGNGIILDYTALGDSSTIGTWHDFDIDTTFINPHRYWRIYVDSTWEGNPEINEIQLIPNCQFFPRLYRSDRIAYYLYYDGVTPVTESTVNKLQRTFPTAVPLGITAIPVFIDEMTSDSNYPEGTVDTVEDQITGPYAQLPLNLSSLLGDGTQVMTNLIVSQGKCNTVSAGHIVTRDTGDYFTTAYTGGVIKINTLSYTVSSVTNTQNLVVGTDPGNQGYVEFNYSVPGTLHSQVGRTPWSAGRFGSSVTLNGTDEYISVPATTIPASGPFMISLWFNPSVTINSGISVEKTLFRYSDNFSTNDIKMVFPVGDGRLACSIYSGFSFITINSNSTSWVAGVEHNVIFIYDGTNLIMKIDGVTQASTATGTRGSTVSTLCAIGAHPNVLRFFGGVLEHFVIYNFVPPISVQNFLANET